MKKILILLFAIIPAVLQAQVVGKVFPSLQAETMDDEIVNLPEDRADKFTLIGMAYSKKSEEDLKTWFNPVYQKFIQTNNGGLFSSFQYDVHVYFVPMFTGVKTTAANAAKKNAIKNLDKRLSPHVLFYKGKLKPYKEQLEFEKKDVPYFFVIDTEGKIVYATSGKYSEAKMDAVEESITE